MSNIESQSEVPLNKAKSKRKFWKFWFIMVGITIGYFLVLIRLFYIQVLEGSEYREKAKYQHESNIEIQADRGNIYDRYGRLLATTIKSYSIAVDPNLLKNKKSVCEALARGTGLKANVFMDKINRSKNSFVWLARALKPHQAADVRSLKDHGLIIIEEPRRSYPYGSTAAQLVGLSNLDSKGTAGIELGLDSILKGKNGFIVMYKDGKGKLRHSVELPVVEPTVGKSVQLTIDVELQRIVEYELTQGIMNSQAEAGTVIVLEPNTGEVLAMASYPLFDPHNITKNSFAAMRMRGITDILEPGSTFKTITAAAGIEENLVTEDEIMDGRGGLAVFKGFQIRDDHPVGRVSFRKAMEQSSNIVLSDVAARIPDHKFYRYLRNFGFGLNLGIDIPGEVSGRIQRPEEFNGGSKRYMGHGYGLNATPLQLVNSYATIANQGVMMKPHIVKAIMDNESQTTKEIKPEKIRRVISESTARRVGNLLVGIVDSGTGRKTIVKGLRIGGKTGTAQQITNGVYSKSDYNASFVGYFPVHDPQIAMIVVIDRPRTSIYGGSSAAPIFQTIASRWASVNPDISRKQFAKDSNELRKLRKFPPDSVVVPSICGLKIENAREVAKRTGLIIPDDYESGIVFTQYPKEGTKVPRGKYLRVTMTQTNSIANTSIDSNRLNEKHDVRGLSLRRAVNLMQNSGVKTRIIGEGKVYDQQWTYSSNKQLICVLYCK